MKLSIYVNISSEYISDSFIILLTISLIPIHFKKISTNEAHHYIRISCFLFQKAGNHFVIREASVCLTALFMAKVQIDYHKTSHHCALKTPHSTLSKFSGINCLESGEKVWICAPAIYKTNMSFLTRDMYPMNKSASSPRVLYKYTFTYTDDPLQDRNVIIYTIY